MIRTLCFACVAFVMLCVFGCQPSPKGSGLNTQFVEGFVTLDGTPLGGVSLTFIPKTEGSGENAGGMSDSGGRYTLSSLNGAPGKGALEGEYVIVASKTESVDLAKPTISPVSGDTITSETRSVLHEIYRDRQKTPLTATVVSGKNKINIELESKPSK